jgi:hypothetical protein
MTEHARIELEPPTAALKRGDKGPKVRQVQEWLCLHDFHTAVDGDFGPATEAALKDFQRDMDTLWEEPRTAYDELGTVGPATWRVLTEPLRNVVQWARQPSLADASAIVDCAMAHLIANPREAGRPNGGSWVRLYCRGQEVPWCAGFATTVLGQALGHDKWHTLSCDELAHKAQARDLWVPSTAKEQRYLLKPGCLFVVRASEYDWVHTGIVTAVGDGYFETIEGNTNTTGAREGTAVHARTRAFGPHIDFVLMGER